MVLTEKILILFLFILIIIILIIKLFFHRQVEKIYRHSKKINTGNLNESLKFWRSKIGLNKNLIIEVEITNRRDFLLQKIGGAYMKMISPNKKYYIKMYYKKSNEGVLLHELSHIKFRHEELKKRGIKRPFEKEANNNVLRYKLELEKRIS